MSETDLSNLDRDALIALILKLQAEVESLKRSGKRQAAPFSKGTRVERPKRPGRKPGRGPFKRREAPKPEELSEPPIDVPVVEPGCPKCGGELVPDRVDEASITDLPEVVKPRVRLFRVGN
jgi:transposase